MPARTPEHAAEFLDRCPTLLIERRPGRVIVDTPGLFQVVDPGMPITPFNAVCRANFAEGSAEERIDEAIARFRALRLPFRWAVNALSSPGDLAERLLARKPASVVESTGFAIEPRRLQATRLPGLSVETLSARNLDDYLQAASESFAEAGPGAVAALRRMALESIARPNPDTMTFLGRWKGRPAGIARLRILRDGELSAGYIGGAGVCPRLRHRPVLLMIGHLGEALLRRGIGLLLAHADDKTASPLLRRLGFEEHGRTRWFEFAAAPAAAS